MSDHLRWPSWAERETPRQAAFNFITRYWGLEVAQRQRALISVPLLPDGEDEEDAEDDRG